MDPANAAPDPTPTRPVAGDPPSIGVPSIPAQGEKVRPPAPVPSLAVTAPLPPPHGVRLAPVAPTGPLPPGRPVGHDPGPVRSDPGFAPGVSTKLRSYVYLLVDPRTGRAFYVGRGRNDRCFRHLAAAHASGHAGATDADRHPKYPMVERIRDIESGGRTVRVDILRHGLSPAEALTVEAAVHDALGLPGEPKGGSQRRPAVELNSALAKRARFKPAHPVVLLPVEATGSATSDDAVRRGWRIGRCWTDLDSPRSPRWAVTLADGLVTGVYRIEGWEPVPAAGGSGPGGAASGPLGDRFSFVGPHDLDLEGLYVGRSAAHYLGHRGHSSVAYVWCGPHWLNAPG